MVQFNLLPDIKMEYIRAERTKRLVITVATLVTIASLAILVALVVVVFFFQKQHMNGLSADINKYQKDLSDTSNIDKILTVQNQLNSLSSLHDKKQATTRIYPFIQQITPTDVSINNIDIDFEANTIMISGSSDAPTNANQLAAVNKFVDTLKFTNFTVKGAEQQRAFKDVVLTTFGRSDKTATYSINLSYEPTIFSNTEEVTLQVPTQITTRSETEKPKALFESTQKAGN